MKPQYQIEAVQNVIKNILMDPKNAGRFTTEFKQKMATGGLKLIPNTKILRKAVTPAGGNSSSLLDEETKKVEGVSDFSQNQLPASSTLVVGQIAIGYDSDAAADKEALLTYAKAHPASFRNAKIVITQSDAIIAESPLAVLINQNITRGTEPQQNFVDLDSAFFIAGGIDFQMKIVWGKGAAPAAGVTEYIEIALKGYETVRAAG
jgi:hypothetical protein